MPTFEDLFVDGTLDEADAMRARLLGLAPDDDVERIWTVLDPDRDPQCDLRWSLQAILVSKIQDHSPTAR